MPQEEIERLLVEHGAEPARPSCGSRAATRSCSGAAARRPRRCAPRGSPFEVVPGVTAGVAAPAYAGIPVTHRDVASAVAFVTGHEDPAKPESALDWWALAASRARSSSTWACASSTRSPTGWSPGGRSRAEPAAVIERGTLPDQRVVTGTLATIAERAAAARVRAPGDRGVRSGSAALRERLEWFERRPLAGLKVAVTRARAQASELAHRLRCLGADVIEAPAIRIAPIAGPAPDLARYDLVCLTSPNGVRAAVRAAGERRTRRPCAGGGAGGGHRSRDCGGAARARRDRRRRARAIRRRGARRGARRRAGLPRPGRPRGAGARRPPRRAPGPRSRGGRGDALRDRRRAAQRARAGGGARRRTTSPSPPPRPSASSSTPGRCAPLGRTSAAGHGWCRSGP